MWSIMMRNDLKLHKIKRVILLNSLNYKFCFKAIILYI